MATNYESPLTLFLKSHKTDHPDTEAQQRAGRAILWDRKLDREAQEGFRATRVPMLPYVYYDNKTPAEAEKDPDFKSSTMWFQTSWLA